jgi:thioester reductase-like protein
MGYEAFSSRVIPIAGDLSKPLFGLSPAEFQTLARTIDTIYHNGASVNWIFPYESLKAANVFGTQEVLRLACQHTVKPVHYVSSLSVFPLLFNTEAKVFREEDDLAQSGVLYGGYTQSKWVAEKMVAIARSRGMPVCIYRPGLITGHSRTGTWNTDDVTCRIFKSIIELGSTPDVYRTVEMTPVDYASQAIVHLSRQSASLGKVFHVINPHTVPWRALFDWLRSFGYPLQTLSYAQWRARLLALGFAGDNTAYTLLPLFSLNLSEHASTMTQHLPTFDCQTTLEALSCTSIVCPAIDRQVFAAYIAYFIRSGFLEAPPSGRVPGEIAHTMTDVDATRTV